MFTDCSAISVELRTLQPYFVDNSLVLSLRLSEIAIVEAGTPEFMIATRSASPIMPAPMIPTAMDVMKQG
jgi:hypothetical protein